MASVTDRVDGELARRRGLVTDFGKIADPIADKALTGAALVGLSLLDELPWWVTVVILVREVGVTLLRFVRDPARRDPGQPRRQAQDRAADAGASACYILPLAGVLDDLSRWSSWASRSSSRW